MFLYKYNLKYIPRDSGNFLGVEERAVASGDELDERTDDDSFSNRKYMYLLSLLYFHKLLRL